MKLVSAKIGHYDDNGNRPGSSVIIFDEGDMRELRFLLGTSIVRGGSVVTIKNWISLYDTFERALLAIGRMKNGAQRDKDPLVRSVKFP